MHDEAIDRGVVFGPGCGIGEHEQEEQARERGQQERAQLAQRHAGEQRAPAPEHDRRRQPPQQVPIRLHEQAGENAGQRGAMPGDPQPAESGNVDGIAPDLNPAQTRRGNLQPAEDQNEHE